MGLDNGGLAHLLDGNDAETNFAWRVLARVLLYSASLIPEVTASPQDIDDAMKLGYNWVKGPFELLDLIGIDAFIDRAEAEDLRSRFWLNRAVKSSTGHIRVN